MENLKYFKLSEFDSPDLPGSGAQMNEEFLEKLDLLREHCGFPFKINSGFRTPEQNKRDGGAEQSAHLLGRAADIACTGQQAYTILKLAPQYGFFGIGVCLKGRYFVHLDDIGMGELDGITRPMVWTY